MQSRRTTKVQAAMCGKVRDVAHNDQLDAAPTARADARERADEVPLWYQEAVFDPI